ncbi:MFS transporter [Desulfosediminicola flagellatus]|uniref:MFS transporter n=1 Tax=Desulfosediminicola flagellatus TaxID=2569541 RepID=UPI0010AC7A3D|nr:MFS transporter [Desulfosediminicola flagellatus]
MIQDYMHFFRRCWPLLVFGMMSVFWGNFGQSFFVSWYGASFQESLDLTAMSYGTAYSMATLSSGLLLMWLGAAIDRISLRWFVTFSALGLFAATLMLWQVRSFFMLVVSLFLLRFFGQGLLPHTAVTTMTREFSINRGKATSIATTGVPMGEIILPSLAVVLISMVGWQNSWLVVGLSVPLLYLPCALWLLSLSQQKRYAEDVRTSNKKSHRSVSVQGSRRTMLKDHRFWLALPAILAAPFIVTGVFIHQGFFLPEMGWSVSLFAKCFVFYGCAHWLSSMYSGALVDRFSGVQLLKFYPLPMVLGLLVPAMTSGVWVAYMLMISLGISIGTSSPIIGALWVEVYGTEHLGAIRALITSLVVISTSASPILFGFLIDSGISGQSLFMWLALYVFIAVMLSLFSFSVKQGR